MGKEVILQGRSAGVLKHALIIEGTTLVGLPDDY